MRTAVAGLRAARLAHGLTQSDLALEADVHPNTVNLLERGGQDPHPSTARKLSEALDVPIPELFPELFGE